MENINNFTHDIKDLDYRLKLAFENTKKENEYFKELVDSINLSDDELMKYTSIIEDCACEYKNCKHCKSLLSCKNKMTGYCYLPVLEDKKINFSYVACKYKKKHDNLFSYLSNVTSIDIPKEIREAKIKDIYTDDDSRTSVINYLIKFIKSYKTEDELKGLFLHGSFGCGKTYLISAMFNELAKKNVKSTIVYWPEYLRSLKAAFSSSSNDEFSNKFNEVKYSKLLLIDDLGAESVTAWNRDEILGSIMQYRMQEGLPTFITSNLNIKELENHLSLAGNKLEKVKAVRIIERIKQLTVDMEMISENKRK